MQGAASASASASELHHHHHHHHHQRATTRHGSTDQGSAGSIWSSSSSSSPPKPNPNPSPPPPPTQQNPKKNSHPLLLLPPPWMRWTRSSSVAERSLFHARWAQTSLVLSSDEAPETGYIMALDRATRREPALRIHVPRSAWRTVSFLRLGRGVGGLGLGLGLGVGEKEEDGLGGGGEKKDSFLLRSSSSPEKGSFPAAPREEQSVWPRFARDPLSHLGAGVWQYGWEEAFPYEALAALEAEEAEEKNRANLASKGWPWERYHEVMVILDLDGKVHVPTPWMSSSSSSSSYP